MPNIPGMQRIGQGIPGGAAGLPVLGASLGAPAVGIPGIPNTPHIQLGPSPTPIPTVAPLAATDTGPDPESQLRLSRARGILNQVQMGRLEPAKAKSQLQKLLRPDEQHQLTQEILRAHASGQVNMDIRPQLQALSFQPLGKSPGASAQMDPTRGKGIGYNLMSDIGGMITGLPAGLGLTGKAVALDLKDLPGDALHGRPVGRHLVHDVVEPIAGQYAKTYGSALHGNLHPLEQHPLGPVLDAAALVSAGLGTAGRISDAATAMRAGRVADVTDVAVPGARLYHGGAKEVTDLDPVHGREGGIYLTSHPDVAKIYSGESHMYSADNPRNLEDMGKTHEVFLPDRAKIFDASQPVTRQISDIADRVVTKEIDLLGEYRDHLDPQDVHYLNHLEGLKSRIDGGGFESVDELRHTMVDVNSHNLHSSVDEPGGGIYEKFMQQTAAHLKESGYSGAKLAAWPGDVREAQRVVGPGGVVPTDEHLIWDKKILQPPRKAPAVAKVGDQYTIHEHAPKLQESTPRDTIRGMNEHELTTDGHPMVNPTPEEIAAEPYLVKHVASTSTSGHQIHYGGNEHDDLWDAMMNKGILHLDPKEGMRFTDNGERQVAATIIHDPNTGRPVAANIGKHEGITDESQIKALEAKILADAQARFVDKRGLNEVAQPEPPRPNSLPKRYSVREQGRIVGQNFPDKESAIAHAKSLISPYGSPLAAYLRGGGRRGGLIDAYEKARGINHEAEIQNTMKEVADVLDNPNLRVSSRSLGQVAKEVVADLRATRAAGRDRPALMAAGLPGFISAGSSGRLLSTGETALREANDLIRAGAIYLRPAYLPNNWAGNLFMNLAHQGVLAPVNLAKSLVIDKYIGKRYTAAMDKAMGQNAAEVISSPTGRGYVSSLTQPVAHVMGQIADQPFRRAAFIHEARRAGYRKLSDVQKLFDRAAGQDEKALHDIGDIARRAQEEIVKFGHMNDTERSVIRNLVFVYSWMRGAARYTGRFPLQHPIQSAVYNHLGNDVGQKYLNENMGGVPSFLMGSVPVGHDSKGNPILINPFALNPLGTGMQIGRAAAGTLHVLRHPSDFNKYAETDLTSLTAPLLQSYIQAREGGRPVKDQIENTIAADKFVRDELHPGRGSIYPMSRTEAAGHFVVGSLFPRRADQAAITKANERENRGDPIALIPEQLKIYKKATGEDIPPEFVNEYKADVIAYQQMKDFQHSYASSHGASGFKGLPAQNRAEAALQFLQHSGHLHPAELNDLQSAMGQMKTDTEFNDFANSLWSMTGIGQTKKAWQSMLRDANGLSLTRARK